MASMGLDFLVYGSRGFLGRSFVELLERHASCFQTSDARIEDRAQVSWDLEMYKPKWVICAAGCSGKPSMVRVPEATLRLFQDSITKRNMKRDWQEGIRSNVLGVLNLVDLCFARNIHVTVFSTGCLYNYDEKHPIGSSIGFRVCKDRSNPYLEPINEDEPANFTSSFYVELKIILERLLESYPNVLNLRVSYPISSTHHAKNLITKLLGFKKITSSPISITVIDELWPIIILMCEQNVTGLFNFTNPGTTQNSNILEYYREFVDGDHTNWELANVGELTNCQRPSFELDVSKLLKLFPDIPNVNQSLIKMMKKMEKLKSEH